MPVNGFFLVSGRLHERVACFKTKAELVRLLSGSPHTVGGIRSLFFKTVKIDFCSYASMWCAGCLESSS